MKAFKPVHKAVTKVYAHPAVKPILTHTGIAGFTIEFFVAVVHTLTHAAAIVLPAYLVEVAEAYMPWRDLNLGWAALALGLVIYCDNAHHAVAFMEKATGKKMEETA